jgi:hypothetical protein
VCELWNIRDVAPGEEMLINYGKAFSRVPWFEELMLAAGKKPLWILGKELDDMFRAAK